MSRRSSFDVPCPRCGALVWQSCIGIRGQAICNAHPERRAIVKPAEETR